MPDELTERVIQGDRRALARVMTLLESDDPKGNATWRAIYPRTGSAYRVGLTGPPGTGKSTLVTQLARRYRRADQTVGIVAVDPTSTLTGGAVLGDRVRMGGLAEDPGVFVRSMASRGQRGGLANHTAAVVDVLDAAGMDCVFLETLGVGQEALDVVGETHTTLLVGAPGQGDEVQAMKAGLLELADILVVNQADRDGASALANAWRWVLKGNGGGGDVIWVPPVIETVATTGQGVDEVVKALKEHRFWLINGKGWDQRAERIAGGRVLGALVEHLLSKVQHDSTDSGLWEELVADVVARRLDPVAAARRLTKKVLDEH